MKVCSSCKATMDLSMFHRDSQKKDGLAYSCKLCRRLSSESWGKRNPEKKKASVRRWHDSNRDRISLVNHAWRRGNQEKLQQINKLWRLSNKELINFYGSMRRARQFQQTPTWADENVILSFYREAERLTRQTGVPHQVDHIVPLQGRSVSGLHSQHNLQVITAAENRRKSNRWAP